MFKYLQSSPVTMRSASKSNRVQEMAKWNRRDVLKSGIYSGVATLLPKPEVDSTSWLRSRKDEALVSAQSSTTIRERLLFDFNWRFTLGHATDPARDFG